MPSSLNNFIFQPWQKKVTSNELIPVHCKLLKIALSTEKVDPAYIFGRSKSMGIMAVMYPDDSTCSLCVDPIVFTSQGCSVDNGLVYIRYVNSPFPWRQKTPACHLAEYYTMMRYNWSLSQKAGTYYGQDGGRYFCLSEHDRRWGSCLYMM